MTLFSNRQDAQAGARAGGDGAGRPVGARPWLIGGGVLAVVGLVIGGWLLARPRSVAYYTDGADIRVAREVESPRDVLWQPPVPLPGVLNSTAQDYEPRLSWDENRLYFVRGKPGENADIYIADRQASGFGEAAPLDAVCGPDDDLGPEPARDDRTLYFYSNRPGGLGGYDIWVARQENGEWQEPVNLGPLVNSEYNEYGPALDPDGKTLYFASNRPRAGDVGPDPDAWPATVREDLYKRTYDLYATQLTDAGPTAAAGLDVLNTEFNDGAPCVSPGGDFLYFCSDRPGGQGAFDLYRARIVRGELRGPENLGPAINTPANELDPGLADLGFGLYFSSDRPAQRLRPDRPNDYNLYFSASRDVFVERDTVPREPIAWAALWRALLPHLLWALLALLLLLLLLVLWRDAQRRRLGLLARCLLASLALHALLLFGFTFWRVSAAVGDFLQGRGEIRIALTPSASAASLVDQVRGSFTDVTSPQAAQAEADQQRVELASETRMLAAELEIAPSRVEHVVAEKVPVGDAALPAPPTIQASLRLELVGGVSAVETPTDIQPLDDQPEPRMPAPVVAAAADQAIAAAHPTMALAAPAAANWVVPAEPSTLEAKPLSLPARVLDGAAAMAVPRGITSATSDLVLPAQNASARLSLPAEAAGLASSEEHAARVTVPAADVARPNAATLQPEPLVTNGWEVPAVPPSSAGVPAPKPARPAVSDAPTATAPKASATSGLLELPPGPAVAVRSPEPAERAPADMLRDPEPAPPVAAAAGTAAPAALPAEVSRVPEARNLNQGPATPPARVADMPVSRPSDLGAARVNPVVPATDNAMPLLVMDVERPVTGLRIPSDTEPPPTAVAKSSTRDEAAPRVGPEAALERALKWLAGHQNADGRWDAAQFDAQCGACGGASENPVDVTLTGLVTLAFVGGGHSHVRDGPYRECVARAVEWLRAQQAPSGDLAPSESAYSHAIATAAIAESYAATRDPTLREPLERAVRHLLDSPVLAGVKGRPDADLALLGWQVLALHSARLAGIEVPPEPLARARQWLAGAESPQERGGYAFQPGEPPSPAMTAEALFIQLALATPRDDPRARASMAYLRRFPPRWEPEPDAYYWYFGSLGLFHMRGPAWREWSDALATLLVSRQEGTGPRTGSWPPDGRTAAIGGRVYQTALCALVLEMGRPLSPMLAAVPEEQRAAGLRGRVTNAATGEPLGGALVRADLADGVPVAAYTGPDGEYEIFFPVMAEHFALTASHPDALPKSVNVPFEDLAAGDRRLDFQLDPRAPDRVVLETIPDVHHLGNDRFEGAINSQFQKRSEGRTFSATFEIDVEGIRAARIALMTRGVQCPHPLRINGRLATRLKGSPDDGSFGRVVLTIDPELLQAGTNTLEIVSTTCHGDLDDFEFVNVQFEIEREGR